MDFSSPIIISDAASAVNWQGLGLGLGLLNRPNSVPSYSQISISAAMIAVEALYPPPVRSNRRGTTTIRRKKRRTRRKSLSGGDDDGGDGGGEGDWLFGGSGPIFGGGGGGGGGGSGRGWNFGGFGGQNWDSSSSSSSPSDPAFDFVYGVVSWIVLSNCVHFAFKKVLRAFAGDAERVKVASIRLSSVC